MEIDAVLSDLTVEMKHVMSLINPAQTYMVFCPFSPLFLNISFRQRSGGYCYSSIYDFMIFLAYLENML